MFRAIGVVILLWYISSLFGQTFSAMDTAGKEVFTAVEMAAVQSQEQFAK